MRASQEYLSSIRIRLSNTWNLIEEYVVPYLREREFLLVA